MPLNRKGEGTAPPPGFIKGNGGRFPWWLLGLFFLCAVAVFLLCVCVGSVTIPLRDTIRTFGEVIRHEAPSQKVHHAILVSVRLPRVLSAALVGASLAISGAAMQGLMRNPLADGSTLGVSTGASLGAVISIAFGISVPGLPFASTMGMAMVFAFLSLVLILSLSYLFDRSFSTHQIILLGVIFSMFFSSLISLIIAFSRDKIHTITYWTMGSLSGANYLHVAVLFGFLLLGIAALMLLSTPLNALAIGEENAFYIGVNVRRIKVSIMVISSVLIGVCVSVGGAIGFVGLIVPHICRLIFGPNHQRLLPASLFLGGSFLMLCDLAARTIVSPAELPIGVVTSLIGAVVFVAVFYRNRKRGIA